MKPITNQPKILISACLLGEKVRYNGTDLFINHPLLKQWKNQDRLIPICPEVAAGMSTPRAPSEIVAGNGQTVLLNQAKVIDTTNKDVTQAFILGAKKALQRAKDNQCIAAILTERSPSCGSQQIYNGCFSGEKIRGMGVTSALLEQNNISVFNQNQLPELADFLQTL